MKWLKKWIPEPEKLPNKKPEQILIEDYNWAQLEINTLYGACTCLNLAWKQLKRVLWEELTK